MTFDDQPTDMRAPIKLPKRLKYNLENKSKINISKKYGFKNCRALIPELMNGNVHIGLANVVRNSDGIIREAAPLMEYKGEYYPHLIFDAAVNYLTDKQNKDITIDRKGNMKIANTTLPITYDGDVILNWYGPSGTHTILPLYKVVREISNNKKDFDFFRRLLQDTG